MGTRSLLSSLLVTLAITSCAPARTRDSGAEPLDGPQDPLDALAEASPADAPSLDAPSTETPPAPDVAAMDAAADAPP